MISLFCLGSLPSKLYLDFIHVFCVSDNTATLDDIRSICDIHNSISQWGRLHYDLQEQCIASILNNEMVQVWTMKNFEWPYIIIMLLWAPHRQWWLSVCIYAYIVFIICNSLKLKCKNEKDKFTVNRAGGSHQLIRLYKLIATYWYYATCINSASSAGTVYTCSIILVMISQLCWPSTVGKSLLREILNHTAKPKQVIVPTR